MRCTHKALVHICHHGIHTWKHIPKHTSKHAMGCYLTVVLVVGSTCTLFNSRPSCVKSKISKWVVKSSKHWWHLVAMVPERQSTLSDKPAKSISTGHGHCTIILSTNNNYRFDWEMPSLTRNANWTFCYYVKYQNLYNFSKPNMKVDF